MDGQATGAGQQWRAGVWLTDGSLQSVLEINRQCLDYLVAMASAGGRPAAGLVARHPAAIWNELSEEARARLAASPYLLADAGFDDEIRWRCVATRMVHDLPLQLAEPVFAGPGATDFIRRVLVFGWHLARANRQLARVVLGMTPLCAEYIAGLSLKDLDWVTENRPGWVRPRWERQPRIWRHLLLAASEHEGRGLTQVSLRGLQLMAAGVLGSGAGVGAGPRPRRG